MKKFYAVIGLLMFATVTTAADHKSLGGTETCVALSEHSFEDYVLSYLYHKMYESVGNLRHIKGMSDLCFRKLDQAEAEAEGYDFSLELRGSDEAIAEAHAQLHKLAQSVVVVEGSLSFSRPRWEFLRSMQQKFRADQGSIKMSLLPSSRNNEIRIYLVAPQQRKDLAEFVLSGIKQNYCQFTFAYQENQHEKIQTYFKRFANSIIADGVCVCIDRAQRIIYFVGVDDANKKWLAHFNDNLNN